MKTIKIDLDSPLPPTAVQDAVRVLERGGLVCLPCCGTYRILADLADAGAVMNLAQSKRRMSKAPSLVFIDAEARLPEVAEVVEPRAMSVARTFWPGRVTILVDAHPELPRKVRKMLTGAVGRIGVRVPDDAIAHQVCEAFGHPLLVSSANRANKHGEESPAQIRKNFFGRVDLLLDAGDLRKGHHSTVVDVLGEDVVVTRVGIVPEDDIMAAARA